MTVGGNGGTEERKKDGEREGGREGEEEGRGREEGRANTCLHVYSKPLLTHKLQPSRSSQTTMSASESI